MRFTLPTLFFMAAGHAGGAAADPVSEIVTFRLMDGADAKTFAQAAEHMTPLLQKTGAALSRTLSADPDGVWTDHITWRSLDDAKAAAAEIMAEPAAAPFMQMIDPDTVVMRHARIWVSQTLE